MGTYDYVPSSTHFGVSIADVYVLEGSYYAVRFTVAELFANLTCDYMFVNGTWSVIKGILDENSLKKTGQ